MTTGPDLGSCLQVYPMKLEEIFQERVWGGDGLAQILGKKLPPEDKIGESWEVSDRPEASNVIRNGAYAGVRLDTLRERFGEELVGKNGLALGRGQLPLLIKFLDCQDRLSVQVHPNDAYAAAHENGSLGKTEMWYIVAAAPNARLWCGLKPGVTRVVLEQAFTEGKVPETLAEIAVKPGDCFFIPAGRVHALGDGLIICEIQQNSDITYRFYDWDRVGLDGRPRALHIPQSLDVIDYGAVDDPQCRAMKTQVPGGGITRLVHCPQFVVELVNVASNMASDTHMTSFHTLSVLWGEGSVRIGAGGPESLRMGETVLIPCAAGSYELQSAGYLGILCAYVP